MVNNITKFDTTNIPEYTPANLCTRAENNFIPKLVPNVSRSGSQSITSDARPNANVVVVFDT